MSASLTLQAIGSASSVVAQGIGNGAMPIPAPLPLDAAGLVTLQWTLTPTATTPLSAATSILTRVGNLQPFSTVSASGIITGTAQVMVVEDSNFLLTSFIPGSPDATMVAQVDVNPPSPRARLLPNGVIAAWSTTNTSTSATMPVGWARCAGSHGSIANLEGRFLMGCDAASASRNQPSNGLHNHGLVSFSATGTSTLNGVHHHQLAGFCSRESSSESGDWGKNPTTGAFCYQSGAGFTDSIEHDHVVHGQASPQTDSSTSAPSPLPPYYVVRFGQKVTTPIA